jgi:hypothetical protein
MYSFFRQACLSLIASALLCIAGTAHAQSIATPILLSDAGTARAIPSVHISITKGSVAPWAARSDVVEGYCYYHSLNIALVDNVFYAVNGIARGSIKKNNIKFGGDTLTIFDMDKEGDRAREFLYKINDKINDACP